MSGVLNGSNKQHFQRIKRCFFGGLYAPFQLLLVILLWHFGSFQIVWFWALFKNVLALEKNRSVYGSHFHACVFITRTNSKLIGRRMTTPARSSWGSRSWRNWQSSGSTSTEWWSWRRVGAMVSQHFFCFMKSLMNGTYSTSAPRSRLKFVYNVKMAYVRVFVIFNHVVQYCLQKLHQKKPQKLHQKILQKLHQVIFIVHTSKFLYSLYSTELQRLPKYTPSIGTVLLSACTYL